jgi:hypothetical protein
MRYILKGATDQSVVVRVFDTAGLPLETVDAQSPLPTFWYRRELGALTTFATVNLAALTTAHADGGIKHIDDAYYRLDVPDAAFASGANGVAIGGTVTGGVVVGAYCQLVGFDPSGTEAGNLRRGSIGLVLGSVASGATLTNIPTDLTEATNDHYVGRYITFTSGALAGQSSDITDYFGAGKELTITALTEAPNQGDEFVIS